MGATEKGREGRRDSLTEVLRQWSQGAEAVAAEATRQVYEELRRIAASFFRRERPEHTLQATALVNEVYIQLREETGVRFANRAHFVGRVAHMMRRLLVDYARKRNAHQRGGGWRRITLNEAHLDRQQRPIDLIALDEALLSLSVRDPDMARLVELRFFGGLTLEETAEVLGISRASVVLAWRRTKIWLYNELTSE